MSISWEREGGKDGNEGETCWCPCYQATNKMRNLGLSNDINMRRVHVHICVMFGKLEIIRKWGEDAAKQLNLVVDGKLELY